MKTVLAAAAGAAITFAAATVFLLPIAEEAVYIAEEAVTIAEQAVQERDNALTALDKVSADLQACLAGPFH